jgi:GxxExxY protein
MEFIKLSEREEYIGKRIVNAAYEVHKELGPGLLEKVYESCIAQVLREDKIVVVRQQLIPVNFKGKVYDDALRLDLLVDDLVICEIKAAEAINPVWHAQILSHLKLTGKNLGYLINFNVPLIKQGIKRFIFNHNK